jgi:8-oxo-dGTP pyrophosphatase MutT (NUDIX family)
MEPKHIDVACAIIVREDEEDNRQVLVLQRAANDHWPLHYDLPRGKCDKPIGEDIMHCLKREIKEETGLDIIPLKYLGQFEYEADNGKRISTQYNYLCKQENSNQEVKLSKEHDSFKWIMSGGEAELLLPSEMKKIVLGVLSQKEKIVGAPSIRLQKNIEEFLTNLYKK